MITRIPICIFAGLGLMLAGCASETTDGPTEVTRSAQGIYPGQDVQQQEDVPADPGMPQQGMFGGGQLLGGQQFIPPYGAGGLIGAHIPQFPMLGGYGFGLPDRLAVAGVITVPPQQEEPMLPQPMPEQEPVD